MRNVSTVRPELRNLLLAGAAVCLIGGGALAQNASPPATAASPGATSGSTGPTQLPAVVQTPPSPGAPPTSGVTNSDPQTAQNQARKAQPDDEDDDDGDAARDMQHSIMMEAALRTMHSRLRLTGEQERLWPPVEQAARELARIGRETREDLDDLDDDNPVAALRRMGEAATEHGEALDKLADAAEPLWAALDNSQKRRLRRALETMHERMHAMLDGRSHGMTGGMDRRHDDDDDGRHGGWRGHDDGQERSDIRQWRRHWLDRRDRGHGWGEDGWGERR